MAHIQPCYRKLRFELVHYNGKGILAQTNID